MRSPAAPTLLAARIANHKTFDRHTAFTLQGESLEVDRILNLLRIDLAKFEHAGDYELTWFRRADRSLVVLLSGSLTVTSYSFAFVGKGRARHLFSSGCVNFEGVSSIRFKRAIDLLLAEYQAPEGGKHGFGGSHVRP